MTITNFYQNYFIDDRYRYHQLLLETFSTRQEDIEIQLTNFIQKTKDEHQKLLVRTKSEMEANNLNKSGIEEMNSKIKEISESKFYNPIK